MRFTFLCVAIGVGLVSCKEKDLNLYSYWQCNQAQKLDTTAIAKKLEGSWSWTKQVHSFEKTNDFKCLRHDKRDSTFPERTSL